jgi:hypothetical protein
LNACGTLVGGPFSRKSLAYAPAGTSELELTKDIIKYNLFFSLRWKVILNLLNHKSGTAGWFKMPQNWYLDPREWFYFLRLIGNVITSLLWLFFLICKSLVWPHVGMHADAPTEK